MVEPILQTEQCPFCEATPQMLNNHIRLSRGNGHGPMGQYPDGYDMGTKSVSEPASIETDSTVEQTSDLQLNDHKADRRHYKCGCGKTLKYHTEQCPQCDEPKQWRGVA